MDRAIPGKAIVTASLKKRKANVTLIKLLSNDWKIPRFGISVIKEMTG
jgi:uncharacterized protein YggU (UPF0235/DUF167 family)